MRIHIQFTVQIKKANQSAGSSDLERSQKRRRSREITVHEVLGKQVKVWHLLFPLQLIPFLCFLAHILFPFYSHQVDYDILSHGFHCPHITLLRPHCYDSQVLCSEVINCINKLFEVPPLNHKVTLTN